jgi:hypothetical protein
MASPDETSRASPEPSVPEPSRAEHKKGRIARVCLGSRELVRIVYRDPEHVAERLTLYATDRRGDESRKWADSARAARPEADVAVLAEDLRIQSAQIALIDGAISGTPFFLALVPGYLMYLLQETRMTLRTATRSMTVIRGA